METGLHERDRAGVQDFVLLENFESEVAFIDNLKKRFQENLIYVSTRREKQLLSFSLSPYLYLCHASATRRSLDGLLELCKLLWAKPSLFYSNPAFFSLQTYIGQVLISVNPYKQLPIYSDAHIKEYRNKHFYEMPPHM